MIKDMTTREAIEILEITARKILNPDIEGYINPALGGIYIDSKTAEHLATAQLAGAKVLRQLREGAGQKKRKRLYISGKMKGLSQGQIDRNFRESELALHEAGYDTINPSKVHAEGLEYEELLQIDFKLIDMCDGIFMQNNWVTSVGAKREHEYARAMGKDIYGMTGIGQVVKVEGR